MFGRREWLVAGAVTLAAACGDNFVPVGPPLAHSGTLFLAAHEDDDMIFMQPELLQALGAGSATTTVYATTAGPHGRGIGIFEAAKMAYGSMVGSHDWDCGMIPLGTITVEHCRLRDRPISLLDFGLPDGAINGDREYSLLHLVEGNVTELAAQSGGSATAESIVDDFTELLEATTPDSIETLELAGSHGRDNSSHMFVASIGMWAAARVGFSGPVTWHRGYNVDTEMPTLDGDDLARAHTMLAYYEACADNCAACGTQCPSVLSSHQIWQERQYSTERVREARGKLGSGDQCLDSSLALGDCASAPDVVLAANGALRIGDACVESSPANALTLAPCTGAPEQFWMLDSDGSIWNGRPPQASPDMSYDHMRCLASQAAPTCGATLQVRWTIQP